jgi:hypothetical protein
MNHTYFFLSFFLLSLGMAFTDAAHAQTEEEVVYTELVRDSRLDELTQKQFQINKAANNKNALSKYKTSGGKYKGYRLMVLNTNNRELAYQTRGQLSSRFPQHKLYMGYQAPYYKLKMGDFLEKDEAEALKKQLAGTIKSGIFVVSDAISLTAEQEDKLLEKISKGN